MENTKKKIIASALSFFLLLIAFMGAVCVALSAIISLLKFTTAPIRKMNETRREVIYNSCRSWATANNSDYVDEILKKANVSAEGVRAAFEQECRSYHTNTVRYILPKISYLDMASITDNAELNDDNLSNYIKGNSKFPLDDVLSVKNQNQSSKEKDYSGSFSTIYMCLADTTYQYRTPWEYYVTLALAKKMGDPETFEQMLKGGFDNLDADGKVTAKDVWDALMQGLGFSDGKIDLKDSDVKAIINMYGADKKLVLNNANISYYGFDNHEGVGFEDGNKAKENIIKAFNDVENGLVEVGANEYGYNLNGQSEILIGMIGSEEKLNRFWEGHTDNDGTTPYITFNGAIYPSVLTKKADTYCATYDDFDWVKINTNQGIIQKFDDEKKYKEALLIPGVKAYGNEEDHKVFIQNSTYVLAFYRKTYKIGEMIQSWRELGIQEEMDDIVINFLDIVSSSSGNSSINEVLQAYTYYKSTGEELVVEYYSNQNEVVMQCVAEHEIKDQERRSLVCNSLDLIGSSTNASKLKTEIARTLAKNTVWSMATGELKFPSVISGTSRSNYQSVKRLDTALELAQVMYKYGMPYQSEREGNIMPSNAFTKDPLTGVTRPCYGINDTVTSGYAVPLAMSVLSDSNTFVSHQGYDWGDIIYPSNTASGSVTNGANLMTSRVGLSSAGFIDFIWQRTLAADGAFYRINATPGKNTNVYSLNMYPSVGNLYDYANYRFIDTNELLPGDLGFLSPNDDENNLVGIYMGDFFWEDYLNVYHSSEDDIYINGEKKNLTNSAIEDMYELKGKKIHLFLVCCASNGSNMYSGVNKVILTSDNIVIPGVATMNFTYFARYVGAVDFDSLVVGNNQNLTPDKNKDDINANKHPIRPFYEYGLKMVRIDAERDYYDFVPFEENDALNNHYQKVSLNEIAFNKIKGYSSAWMKQYEYACLDCSIAVIKTKEVASKNATKATILLGDGSAPGSEYGTEDWIRSYGAIEYAVEMLCRRTDVTYTRIEAEKLVYGILAYGYRASLKTDEGVVELLNGSEILEQIKSGTYFVWPIRSGMHHVTGFFDYYSAEDVAELPSLAGKFHKAVDIAPVQYNGEWEEYVAMADGYVSQVFETYGGGKTIVVMYSDELNLRSTYKHCSDILKQAGDVVKKGDVVALAGNTGADSTGAHLHVEMNAGEGEGDDVFVKGIKISDLFSHTKGTYFAITDLFDYNWNSWERGLSEEEKNSVKVIESDGGDDGKQEIKETATDRE